MQATRCCAAWSQPLPTLPRTVASSRHCPCSPPAPTHCSVPLNPKESAKRSEALRRKALQRAHSRVQLGEPHNSGLGRLIEAAKNKLHLPLGGDLERVGSGELAPRSPSAAEQAGGQGGAAAARMGWLGWLLLLAGRAAGSAIVLHAFLTSAVLQLHCHPHLPRPLPSLLLHSCSRGSRSGFCGGPAPDPLPAQQLVHPPRLLRLGIRRTGGRPAGPLRCVAGLLLQMAC